jgi:hypothetical protein
MINELDFNSLKEGDEIKVEDGTLLPVLCVVPRTQAKEAPGEGKWVSIEVGGMQETFVYDGGCIRNRNGEEVKDLNHPTTSIIKT